MSTTATRRVRDRNFQVTHELTTGLFFGTLIDDRDSEDTAPSFIHDALANLEHIPNLPEALPKGIALEIVNAVEEPIPKSASWPVVDQLCSRIGYFLAYEVTCRWSGHSLKFRFQLPRRGPYHPIDYYRVFIEIAGKWTDTGWFAYAKLTDTTTLTLRNVWILSEF
jgi:hypothetical protein